MPDPALPLPSPPPAYPRVVLVDRAAVFIDELHDIVEGAGGLPPDRSRSTVLPSRSSRKAGEALEAEVEAEVLRYAILRERKASRSSAVRKEPVTFRCEDPAYYPEVLDGIDLHLPDKLAPAPTVNSLTIGISWPPYHHLRNYPQSAHIASSHDGLLVLYFGIRHPGLPRPWFYLVFNTCANSVAVVPPSPTRCVTPTSHCDFGGVVIQRHKYHYILAELYLRRHSQTHLASNKATLFIWSSPGFGTFDGWWVQKEVVLPLPADEDHRMPLTYSFKADMVFAVSTTSLCWVDLRTGILLCDGITKLVGGGSTDVDFKFCFIPLPKECTIGPGYLPPLSQVEEYRSMSCMNCDTIEFVSMDGGIEATLTTWILKLHLMDDWRWEKCSTICIRDLPYTKYFYDWKQLRFMLSCPVISIIPDVTYLSIASSQYKPEHEQLEAVGFHELCLDTNRERVLSMFKLPSGSRIVPHSMTWICDRSQQWREIMELRMEEEEKKELRFEEEESKGGLPKKEPGCWQHRSLTREWRMANEKMRKLRIEEKESKHSLSKMGFQKRKLLMQKRLADVGEPNSSPSKTAACDSDVLSRTSGSLRLHPTKTVGVSPCSSKEPVGLQCALW